MPVLGLDTSNYTTSAALFDGREGKNLGRLLEVRPGGLGLRQSDALFQHVRRLPELLKQLAAEGNLNGAEAVGASTRPRAVDGSYMPCFLAGKSQGQGISAVLGVPFYGHSHQQGHLAAAAWSAGRLDLLDRPFLAWHLSGGTTELLLVRPEGWTVSAEIIGGTSDLSAGQLIDRVGQMLDLGFPAGPQVEQLALRGRWGKKQTPAFRGRDCCLSGMENKARQLLEGGTSPEDLCRFVLEHIAAVLCRMAEEALAESPGLPLVFSGGVMSNSILRQELEGRFACSFASPEFSADNAAGTAIIGSILHHRGREGTEWQQASRSSPSPSSAGM